ncbi:C69 family dipeptidase [Oceanivirga salmonicida]|uniref:C69 family dipeptidase n=1 Tax=Oceanivirga salmonicida TaxID=1769291 RepID=UPI00082F084C|nr:C69 family dipeptidase [Oceanivirga salmonicida]
MACTTILVGKNASYDGSTLVARNEDSGASGFMPKKMVVVKKNENPKKYISVLSKVEIDLPEKSMHYTATPNAIKKQGLWACCGVNELNISMSATETITANERVLGADPLVKTGIGEEDMVTITLPYIKSAREGVIRLGALLEKYGTYEMNGIAFQDENEIWWLETIGGHHWMAKRVPDNEYVVMPNQLGIDSFDLKDAFGKQKEHMCSSDLKEFITKYHLDLRNNDDEIFNPRHAFGTNTDADHVYNTPRAWVIQRYFNRNWNLWDGTEADYRPDSDDIPWSRVPEKKITIEDIKYVLSHHFQGTPYDPYIKRGDTSYKGAFRPIGINRNNVLGLVQIRPYMPKDIKAIQWMAFGSNVFNAIVPFYVNVDAFPKYFSNTTDKVTTNNFYWTNRIIAALADANFNATSSHIERYQIKVLSMGNNLVNKYDALCDKKNSKKISEKANEEITKMVQKETEDLLNKVLLSASLNMKNGFARSDA